MIDEDKLPHLLFYGPPGTGKTSTILAAARKIFTPRNMQIRVLEVGNFNNFLTKTKFFSWMLLMNVALALCARRLWILPVPKDFTTLHRSAVATNVPSSWSSWMRPTPWPKMLRTHCAASLRSTRTALVSALFAITCPRSSPPYSLAVHGEDYFFLNFVMFFLVFALHHWSWNKWCRDFNTSLNKRNWKLPMMGSKRCSNFQKGICGEWSTFFRFFIQAKS